METFIIFLLGCFVGMLAAAALFQMQERHRPKQRMEECINELLRLEQTVGIVSKLQYDELCKKELAEVIHGLFFFRALKKTKKVYEQLTAAMNRLSDNHPEELALKKMYQSILDEIHSEWLAE